MNILSFHLEKKGLKTEDGVNENVLSFFREMKKKGEFGNGDSIMKVITKGEMELSRRITETQDENLTTLKACEFLSS